MGCEELAWKLFGGLDEEVKEIFKNEPQDTQMYALGLLQSFIDHPEFW